MTYTYIYICTYTCLHTSTHLIPRYTNLQTILVLEATVHHFQTAKGLWMNRQTASKFTTMPRGKCPEGAVIGLGEFYNSLILTTSSQKGWSENSNTNTLLYNKRRSFSTIISHFRCCFVKQSQLHVWQFITATARRWIECRGPGEVGVCRSVNPIQWCTLRLRLTLPSEFCENGNYTTNRVTISWIIISSGQVIGTWPISGREKRRLGARSFWVSIATSYGFLQWVQGPWWESSMAK